MSPFQLKVHTHFSAALRLPAHPGACNAIHGYSYRVTATAATDAPLAGNRGLDLMSFHQKLCELCQELDHHYLNDLPAFSHEAPSGEAIARWLYQRLSMQLDDTATLINIHLKIGEHYDVIYQP